MMEHEQTYQQRFHLPAIEASEHEHEHAQHVVPEGSNMELDRLGSTGFRSTNLR